MENLHLVHSLSLSLCLSPNWDTGWRTNLVGIYFSQKIKCTFSGSLRTTVTWRVFLSWCGSTEGKCGSIDWQLWRPVQITCNLNKHHSTFPTRIFDGFWDWLVWESSISVWFWLYLLAWTSTYLNCLDRKDKSISYLAGLLFTEGVG